MANCYDIRGDVDTVVFQAIDDEGKCVRDVRVPRVDSTYFEKCETQIIACTGLSYLNSQCGWVTVAWFICVGSEDIVAVRGKCYTSSKNASGVRYDEPIDSRGVCDCPPRIRRRRRHRGQPASVGYAANI